MVAAAHQAQFDLILDIFNVECAATGTRAQQRAHHALGQLVDGFADAGGCRTLRAVNRQKSFHHRDCDFAGFERDHRAIASDDLVLRVGVYVGQRRAGFVGNRSPPVGFGGRCCSLHIFAFGYFCKVSRLARNGAAEGQSMRFDPSKLQGSLKHKQHYT